MRKSYQIGFVLMSAALVAVYADTPSAFAQKFGIKAIGSDQNNKKDKDKDDQNNNQGSSNSNNNQGNNQGNQGGQNNQSNNSNKQNNSGNSSNSGTSNKSGSSSSDDKIKQFLQNKINQGQGGNQGQFNQGQGSSNNNKSNNNFRLGNSGNAQSQGQRFKVRDDDDWDHNKNRISIGSWNNNQWQGSRKVDNWSKVYGNNQKLFSKQWYDDHPHAWKWDNHNHKSDVWVVATVPGVYQWLGWGDVPQQYQVNYGPNYRFDPSDYGDWYPLGVYSLMTGADDMGTRVVQLALDRHGRLNGTYYDMITDTSYQLSGAVQQQTQRAEWTLNSNPNIRFRASVMQLLQPDGNISVQLPGGEQRWQFVRLENEQQP